MKNHWLDKKNENKFTEDLKALNVQLTLENCDLKQKLRDVEGEYNKKLEQAYEQFSKELAEAERTAEQGYEEAYQIICDLRKQLEEEQAKNRPILKHFPPSNTISPSVKITDQDLSYKAPDDLEVRLYTEYEQKLKDMKEFFVNKVDEFLTYKCAEMTPQEVRDKYTAQQIVDEATK